MKIIDAQKIYREQRQTLTDQRNALIKRRDELEKRAAATPNGSELFSEEAATLELSIKDVNEKFDKNQEVLDKLAEKYAAVWNSEVAKQQADAMEEMAVDMVKIMEVARRIADGAIVPGKDEQKLMEYSMELYMAAKNMAAMKAAGERDKYDSLWDDDEEKQEYDPQGKAENADAGMDLPDTSVSGAPIADIPAADVSAAAPAAAAVPDVSV